MKYSSFFNLLKSIFSRFLYFSMKIATNIHLKATIQTPDLESLS